MKKITRNICTACFLYKFLFSVLSFFGSIGFITTASEYFSPLFLVLVAGSEHVEFFSKTQLVLLWVAILISLVLPLTAITSGIVSWIKKTNGTTFKCLFACLCGMDIICYSISLALIFTPEKVVGLVLNCIFLLLLCMEPAWFFMRQKASKRNYNDFRHRRMM